MLKTYFQYLYSSANSLNHTNILDLVRGLRPSRFMDLGCDDGVWTSEVSRAADATATFGIELIESQADLARKKSVDVTIANLAETFPESIKNFDLVHANQVIEHVADVDKFVSEVFRILKPGGYAVVSTENGSSWHNIIAAIFGWQIFSLTNMSALSSGVGNPLALHRGAKPIFSTWTHKVIFNYRGLKEFFELHGFVDVQIRGAGYHPLPAIFGRWDPRHAHFITVRARKPDSAHATRIN